MSTCHIESFSHLDAGRRREWTDLADRLGLNPSLGPGWLDVSAPSVGRDAEELSVFVEESESSSVCGVVPFYRSRITMFGIGTTVLQLASNLMSYHAEIIAAGDPGALLRRFLASVPAWDVFHAAGLDVDGRTAKALQSMARELGAALQVIPGDVSPYLPIEGTWTQYLSGRHKKFRYKLRHRRDLLDQDKSCRIVWYQAGANTEGLLSNMLAVEAKSWKARKGIDIGSNPREIDYHRRLLPFLSSQGTLFADVLYREQRPIAYCLCCRHNGWIGQLKTSFDESFSQLSPGSLVIDAAIERGFESGAREFDFLGHADPHKLAWTARVRSHASYFLFGRGLKARAIGLMKQLSRHLKAWRGKAASRKSD